MSRYTKNFVVLFLVCASVVAVVLLAVQTQLPPNVAVDDCGPKTAEGCCTGKGESWCSSLRECVSPSVKQCPGGGGGPAPVRPGPAPVNPNPTQTCPAGSASGIRKSVCETTYCTGNNEGVFFNDADNNGIACCRCQPKAAAPQPTQPVASGGACSGPLSAGSCRDLKPGDIVGGNVCQCQSTGNNNCACVGLRNRGEGESCSADTNCAIGTSCVGGKCSRAKAGAGGVCKYDNDCVDGFKCENDSCQKPLERTSCGTGYCQAGTSFKCENNICKAVDPNSDRFPEYELTEPPVAINPDDIGEFGGGVAASGRISYYDDSGNLVEFIISHCDWYSPTEALIVDTDGVRRQMKGYTCYDDTSACSTITDADQMAECERVKASAGNVVWKIRGQIVSQADIAIRNRVFTDKNGDSCKFVDFGCGPSSVTYLLNERGTQYDNPSDLLATEYENYDCSTRSTQLAENVAVLNRFGVATGEKVVLPEGTDLYSNELARKTLENGGRLLVSLAITTPRGTQFGHFAVVTGGTLREDGTYDPIIFDPFFCEDGTANTESKCGTSSFSALQATMPQYAIVAFTPVEGPVDLEQLGTPNSIITRPVQPKLEQF